MTLPVYIVQWPMLSENSWKRTVSRLLRVTDKPYIVPKRCDKVIFVLILWALIPVYCSMILAKFADLDNVSFYC